MSTTVSDINARAHILLNEAAIADASRRWTDAELFLWVVDGQREIGKAIPSALSETATLTLQSGPRQSIPTTWDLLLRVVRNTNGPTIRTTNAGEVRKRTALLTLQPGALQTIPTHWEALVKLGGPVRFPRLIDGGILSAADPEWASRTPRTRIDEYLYDPNTDPRIFYVNPPASAGVTMNATGVLTFDAWYSDAGNTATTVEESFYHPNQDQRTFYVNPGVLDGVQIEAVGRKAVLPVANLTDALQVPDRFIPALSLYVAHRAMQKQSDYALAGIANAFLQEYAASIKLAEGEVSPPMAAPAQPQPQSSAGAQ